MRFQIKKTKNKGQGLPACAIITPGKLKVKQSTSQLAHWARGIILAGTTYGKYAQTSGPNVIPYIINKAILNTRIITARA
jgi:hypothetical protein